MSHELLLELLSEEIPARMQQTAARELARATEKALGKASLAFSRVSTEATPRRLLLLVEGLPETQPDVQVERKGPRVGAPQKALDGFTRSVGRSVEELEVRQLAKGEFYFAVLEEKGRAARDVLAEVLGDVIARLPWPKSMRWGDQETRWVRPLHSILCLFQGEVVPVRFGHLHAGNVTSGHRFLSPQPFPVRSSEDYHAQLRSAQVILKHSERTKLIEEGARALTAELDLELLSDPALLAEVAGLVEYPVVLLGNIEPEFMDLPPEILTTSLRVHQKYFSVVRPDGSLAPHFVTVSNMDANDGGIQIRAGNERVLRARLSDAMFFWKLDRSRSLEDRVQSLSTIVYQARFGDGADSLAHRVERLRLLARCFSVDTGADPDLADRAALLAKADLVTSVVQEFPEVQGVMGRYYALNDGENSEVADAIAGHYSPQGPGDQCPAAPTATAVALADKLDALVGFFAVNEKPTGSKDPFALRRAALGILRILLENQLRVPLRARIQEALSFYPEGFGGDASTRVADELLLFFADRLQVHLKDRGVRHDLIAAVFAVGDEDDLVRLMAKVDSLQKFLSGDDGSNLVAAHRRASNIVRIEEKKDGVSFSEPPASGLLAEPAEHALVAGLDEAEPRIQAAIQDERFGDAMSALASLRRPVDAFFEDVTVNAEDPPTRVNRLRILSRIRRALDSVADFGLIATVS